MGTCWCPHHVPTMPGHRGGPTAPTQKRGKKHPKALVPSLPLQMEASRMTLEVKTLIYSPLSLLGTMGQQHGEFDAF